MKVNITRESADTDNYTAYGTNEAGQDVEMIYYYDDWFNAIDTELKESGEAWEMLLKERRPGEFIVDGVNTIVPKDLEIEIDF